MPPIAWVSELVPRSMRRTAWVTLLGPRYPSALATAVAL